MKQLTITTLLVLVVLTSSFAQKTSNHANAFEPIDNLLPGANQYRSIDGNPGPDYWQQQCDYDIECTLDPAQQRLDGKETITYYNQSPNTLRYLWLQLDENQHAVDNDNAYFDASSMKQVMSENDMQMVDSELDREKHGCKIQSVTAQNGNPLKYTINQTMMRIDLPQPLKPGEQFVFNIEWYYYLVDRVNLESATAIARGGYEYFPDDGNYLFTIVQWYPRLCSYNDYEGWQNKQFVGLGEFALTFGNFLVKMTLPADYMVGSTGECLNYNTVLTPTQLSRWKQAQTATEPLEIVTLEEAKKLEKQKPSTDSKTWIYKAENVRDFAWTASRKFIWDAMPHTTEDGNTVMCMSYYGKEAYPIYSRYSTKATEHTLDIYSKYSIPYPYPIAISVEAANGMEYPMICFNPGRAEKDGTYTEQAKYSAITVIIHEVGHNYFPMIINSDERQHAWFDEGLNSFIQYLAEKEWNNDYPSWFGPANTIVEYMSRPDDALEPIMTTSDHIVDYFMNAYAKPAAGLNILRETVMGRELFDFAFKEYCRRWAFKHPTPADFFRTMEDASGVDLDWFWRGWFYGIDPVDIAIDSVIWYKADLENDPEPIEQSFDQRSSPPADNISKRRNREEGIKFKVEEDEKLQDFYYNYKPWETEDSIQQNTMVFYAESFSKKEKEEKFGGKNYYELRFSNKGGLVMPVVLEWTYEDGTTEIERLPVTIWRKNESSFTKVFAKDKKVTGIILDPFNETPDIDVSNNNWPEVNPMPTRFQVFKQSKMKEKPNPMQKAQGKKIKP